MQTYLWTVTGNATIDGPDDQQCVQVDAGAAGSYTVTLAVVDGNGCENECDKDVTVNPLPTCSIDGPDEVNAGAQNVEYCGPPSMASYAWSVSYPSVATSGSRSMT